MGQAGLSAVNLVIEDLEAKRNSSSQMIANIEKELDENQKSLDYYCFDLLNKYKVSNEQGKKIFGFMKNAESLERIGDICLGISNKFHNIKTYSEFEELINLGQYIKIIMTNSIIFLKENNINLTVKDDKGMIKKYSDDINLKSIEKMKSDKSSIPDILFYVTISKYLIKIYKLCLSMYENINYYI